MIDYYYRDSNEAGEVIIQAVRGNGILSVRVTEDDGQTTAVINLPESEIDRMIAGLQQARSKLASKGVVECPRPHHLLMVGERCPNCHYPFNEEVGG